MSYKNPQKVVSKAFDVSLGLLKAETQDLYRREAEDRKQQRRFGEMATQALMNKKAQQRSFDQAQRKQEQDLYNRVASLQVGSTKYDKNSEDYFFDLIGKSNEIKRHLADNTMIDRELGKRDLARINNLVNVYGEAQPRIVEASNILKEAALIPEGQPGSLASYGVPVDQQEIIVGITEGKDIKIVDKDGQLFLFDQEKGTKLNVNEFINAFDNPNNPYIKRVPDIAKNLKASYDNFTQKDVNKMSQFISEETVTNSVGDKVEVKFMTPQQQDKLEDALKGRKITGTDYYSGGQFKKMLELNGNAIWEDIMPDEITLRDKNWGTWQPKSIDDPEYDEFYEKQYKPALEYLANRTIEENSGDIDLQRRYTGKVYKKQEPRKVNQKQQVVADYSDIVKNSNKLIKLLNNPNQRVKDKKLVSELTGEALENLEKLSDQEKAVKDTLKRQLMSWVGPRLISGLRGGKTGIADFDIVFDKDSSNNDIIKIYPKQKIDGEIKIIDAFAGGIILNNKGLLELDKDLGLDEKAIAVSSNTNPTGGNAR